jgi:hypothetical protein
VLDAAEPAALLARMQVYTPPSHARWSRELRA